MYSKFFKLSFLMFFIASSICGFDNEICFAHPHSSELSENISKNVEDRKKKCGQKIAETAINMLIATRSVITKNQELINTDPLTGNYYFKGFVPAIVGSEAANDFSLKTGYKLRQTSLKVRNPSNAPDKWERKVLKSFESSKYPKGVGFGEIIEADGTKIYRYIKPIYAEKGCLECHGQKEDIKPEIRQFLAKKYPGDQAFGYKRGDLRGGISIIIPCESLDIE